MTNISQQTVYNSRLARYPRPAIALTAVTYVLLGLLETLPGTVIPPLLYFFALSILALYLMPYVLGLPNGRKSLRDYCLDVRLLPMKPLWRNLLLGLLMAALTLSSILLASLLTKHFVLDWSTVPALRWVKGLTRGIWEEVFFRGIILALFMRLYPLRKAVFLSSFLFAVVHLNPMALNPEMIVDAVSLFFMGLLFIYIILKTGSLLPAIVFHYVHDIFVLLVQNTPGADKVLATALLYSFLWVAMVIGAMLTKYIVEHWTTRTSSRTVFDTDRVLKIVHIITRLIVGGAQENTLISCKFLAERGHDVTLITGPALGPEGQLFDQTKNQKYNVILINELRRAIEPVKDVISYYKIKKYLRLLQPDIVHTHSAKAGILSRYAAWSLKDEWIKGRPAVVHTIHGLAFHSYQCCLLNRFYIAVEKAAAKRTDFFISVADAMTSQALAAGIGRPEQFVTAYSAIEEEQFLEPILQQKILDFRKKYDIAEDAIVFVTIARLFMLKGHDYILESAKQLSGRFEKAVWLFIGGGNLSDFYKQQIHKLGLTDKIKFTGLVQPNEIPLAIQSSDILVHCSLREGLARTLPQAMLCGKPAISFDIDGAREVVNENTGRLIEPKNVEQLTNACAELIENKELRNKLGRYGRESIQEKFAPDTMVNKIEEVYQELLGR